jgi:excisionase family DNA binding protein
MTETPTPITDYISTAEASKRYGLSDSQIRQLLIRGRIRGRKIARNWLVEPSSIEAYLANRPKRGLKPGTKLSPRRKSTS